MSIRSPSASWIPSPQQLDKPQTERIWLLGTLIMRVTVQREEKCAGREYLKPDRAKSLAAGLETWAFRIIFEYRTVSLADVPGVLPISHLAAEMRLVVPLRTMSFSHRRYTVDRSRLASPARRHTHLGLAHRSNHHSQLVLAQQRQESVRYQHPSRLARHRVSAH